MTSPQAGPHHLHSLVEVTVSKDDEGRLPAQLQGHFLHVTHGTTEMNSVGGFGSMGDSDMGL